FLVIPSIFDSEPQLRISKKILGGFGIGLLALGFSLAALSSFCSRSWAFTAEHVLIPCIFACLIGFLNVPYCFIISTRFRWNVAAMTTMIGAASTAFLFTISYFFARRRFTQSKPEQNTHSDDINLLRRPSNTSASGSYHTQSYFANHIANMYPAARTPPGMVAVTPPDEQPLNDVELQRRRMSDLLHKPETQPSPATSPFNRIDFIVDETESPLNGYYAPTNHLATHSLDDPSWRSRNASWVTNDTRRNSSREERRREIEMETLPVTHIMCWGIETLWNCELCRHQTVDADINWQGCHLKASSEVYSYPICSTPIITQELQRRDCTACLCEADDGGNPDDMYPEPFDHPGFPLPRPQINIARVELPEPTAYETIREIENLAGDELPSYDQAINELPRPPCYALLWVRNEAIHESVVTEAVYTQAVERHQGLIRFAHKRRQDIREFQNKVPQHAAQTKALLDLAYERIETLLSEQEETISRISLLQKLLESIMKDVNFEGSYYPSPSEMTLLKYKGEAIIRELEEKYLQRLMLATPEDWDLRIEKLLKYIADEWRETLDANVEELLREEESRASSSAACANTSSD
ncbi:hypothetical protein KCU67_g3696, partial [Aureobasidium melanogenum]